MRVLNQTTQKKPNISRWSRRFTQTNHKTTEPHKNSPPTQSVFLCVIMQLAAFLCIICAICGRIYIQTYSINIHRRNPNVSRRSRWFTQTNHKKNDQTAITSSPYQPVFLCDIMQPAAFVCVICAICGRITRKSTQCICTRKPQYLPLISQITQTNHKTALTSNKLSFSAW